MKVVLKRGGILVVGCVGEMRDAMSNAFGESETKPCGDVRGGVGRIAVVFPELIIISPPA